MKKTIFPYILTALLLISGCTPSDSSNTDSSDTGLPNWDGKHTTYTGLKEIAFIPLWIAAWFATDVFVIFLFKQFFETLPKPLIEAARMEGASELSIFFRIALPLNKPAIVTVILLYFVGTYNDLYGPALYISDKSNWVMANSITIFENLYQSGSSSYIVPWNYVSAATLIAMIPVVLLFALLQKQFMQSVAGTGIKG